MCFLLGLMVQLRMRPVCPRSQQHTFRRRSPCSSFHSQIGQMPNTQVCMSVCVCVRARVCVPAHVHLVLRLPCYARVQGRPGEAQRCPDGVELVVSSDGLAFVIHAAGGVQVHIDGLLPVAVVEVQVVTLRHQQLCHRRHKLQEDVEANTRARKRHGLACMCMRAHFSCLDVCLRMPESAHL